MSQLEGRWLIVGATLLRLCAGVAMLHVTPSFTDPRSRGVDEATALRAHSRWGRRHGLQPTEVPLGRQRNCLQAQQAGRGSVHPTWSGREEAGLEPVWLCVG